MMSDLDMSHEKMSDFVLFAMFVFVLVIKLRNLYFESYWNTLIFLDKKNVLDSIIPCQTVSDLV